jgi:hypothetical protein
VQISPRETGGIFYEETAMKKWILILMLLVLPVQAAEYVFSFDPVTDPSVTGYRAYFSATQNGPTFQTIDVVSPPLTFDNAGLPATYYICVASTNGQGLFSPCSDSVKIDMGQPSHVWPTEGWKSLAGNILWRYGYLNEISYLNTGHSTAGASVQPPMFPPSRCPYGPYGDLALCVYQP